MTDSSGQYIPTRLQVLGGNALIASAFIAVAWMFVLSAVSIFISSSPSFRIEVGLGGIFSFIFSGITLSISMDILLVLLNLSGLFILHHYQPPMNKFLRRCSLVIYIFYGLQLTFYLVQLQFPTMLSSLMFTPEYRNILFIVDYLFIANPIALIVYSVCLLLNVPWLRLSAQIALWTRISCWLLIGGCAIDIVQEVAGYLWIYEHASTEFPNSLPLSIVVTLITQAALAFLGVLLLRLRIVGGQATIQIPPQAVP